MIQPFKGKMPELDPGAYIAPTAAIIGDVKVGKDSSVWFGTVIRGDNASITIDSATSIQDNTVLHCEPGHPMHIGSNVTVGHSAVVHCSEVGDNTLIGMGAIVLDGAVIGKNCIIAAGAVVKENAVVPDGTMMAGVPAKAIRTLDAERIAAMQRPSHYVYLAGEYLSDDQI